MLKNVFRKTQYVKIPSKMKSEPNIPSDMWIKCKNCGEIIYKDDFKNSNMVCEKCEEHFRLNSHERIDLIIDKDSFKENNVDIITKNALDFSGYEEKIQGLKEKTGLSEAVLTGIGNIYGESVAIAVMDSRFLMGSMGSAVGEKITRLVEEATIKKLPLIIFTASGGARMQEGIISLMQMAKTSAAIGRFSEEGGLYISILTDPTTGGVTASFAMLGDIILAEPGSLIGFAGPRVIKQTIKQELPEGFQKAEFLLEHGFIDKIVKRKDMKEMLYKIIKLHE